MNQYALDHITIRAGDLLKMAEEATGFNSSIDLEDGPLVPNPFATDGQTPFWTSRVEVDLWSLLTELGVEPEDLQNVAENAIRGYFLHNAARVRREAIPIFERAKAEAWPTWETGKLYRTQEPFQMHRLGTDDLEEILPKGSLIRFLGSGTLLASDKDYIHFDYAAARQIATFDAGLPDHLLAPVEEFELLGKEGAS